MPHSPGSSVAKASIFGQLIFWTPAAPPRSSRLGASTPGARVVFIITPFTRVCFHEKERGRPLSFSWLSLREQDVPLPPPARMRKSRRPPRPSNAGEAGAIMLRPTAPLRLTSMDGLMQALRQDDASAPASRTVAGLRRSPMRPGSGPRPFSGQGMAFYWKYFFYAPPKPAMLGATRWRLSGDASSFYYNRTNGRAGCPSSMPLFL